MATTPRQVISSSCSLSEVFDVFEDAAPLETSGAGCSNSVITGFDSGWVITVPFWLSRLRKLPYSSIIPHQAIAWQKPLLFGEVINKLAVLQRQYRLIARVPDLWVKLALSPDQAN
jgi:hypothetical protein